MIRGILRFGMLEYIFLTAIKYGFLFLAWIEGYTKKVV